MNESMNGVQMRTISTKASVFIIPNHASLAEDLLSPSSKIREHVEIAELNGFEYDECKDHLIQVWIHADDVIKSDNLDCHGAVTVINEEKYRIECRCGFIGEHVLRGHKEGDLIRYKIPAFLFKAKSDLDGAEEIILDMELTLDQLHYRYKKFGPFEDVLRSATR